MITSELDLHKGIENYDRLAEIFKVAVSKNFDNYDVIYCDYLGKPSDLAEFCTSGLKNDKMGFCIGFDKTSPRIAILPIKQNLLSYGQPIFLEASDINKIEVGKLRKVLRIYTNIYDNKPIDLHISSRIRDTKRKQFLPISQTTYVNNFYCYLKQSGLTTRFTI